VDVWTGGGFNVSKSPSGRRSPTADALIRGQRQEKVNHEQTICPCSTGAKSPNFDTAGSQSPQPKISYGCFDRNFPGTTNYWFSSGMAQEFVWPWLMIPMYQTSFNSQQVIRDWSRLEFSTPLGVLSRWFLRWLFPYERASGAALFSPATCTEKSHAAKARYPSALRFFTRRADWLAKHHESGHQPTIKL